MMGCLGVLFIWEFLEEDVDRLSGSSSAEWVPMDGVGVCVSNYTPVNLVDISGNCGSEILISA